jgi:hypothetical protein
MVNGRHSTVSKAEGITEGGNMINLRGLIILALVALAWALSHAHARDAGQWGATPKEEREWFARQKMPDRPIVSCCGEADAYFSDSFVVENGRVFAIITDDRDDAPLGRPHIDVGTRIEVPAEKFKDSRDDPNPTGHGVLFVGTYRKFDVYCYIAPTGV